jgi:AcrR family transcriptional regulator
MAARKIDTSARKRRQRLAAGAVRPVESNPKAGRRETVGPLHGRLPILDQDEPQLERADAARNRIAILEAARRLLKKRPIGEICMDELAEAAGVGKGTLYRRFEDRSSLCRALLHDNALALQAEVLRGFDLPPQASWTERLDRLLDALFDFTAENAPLLSEAAAFERARNRYDHPAHGWQRQEIALHLRKAAERREIAPCDPEVTADLIIAAIDPDLLAWHLARGKGRPELKASFQRLVRLGILRRPSGVP